MNTATDIPVERVPARAAMFGHVAEGVTNRLPVPITLSISPTGGSFYLVADDNDRDAVDAWTRWLGLGAATNATGEPNRTPRGGGTRTWRRYGVTAYGWAETIIAEVWCVVDEPAPAAVLPAESARDGGPQ